MADRVCGRCKKPMVLLEGEFVLLPGADIPAWGSKTEVMITPKRALRVRVWKCSDEQCASLEFAHSPPQT